MKNDPISKKNEDCKKIFREKNDRVNVKDGGKALIISYERILPVFFEQVGREVSGHHLPYWLDPTFSNFRSHVRWCSKQSKSEIHGETL